MSITVLINLLLLHRIVKNIFLLLFILFFVQYALLRRPKTYSAFPALLYFFNFFMFVSCFLLNVDCQVQPFRQKIISVHTYMYTQTHTSDAA